ncbi:MAG: 4-alpha-glucanotransferase [Bacteroidetes bacterium]|nr:4-alpha-glucanotransferase [Bacteroidota bacterium]
MNIRFKIHYKTKWGQSLKLLLYKNNPDDVQEFEMFCNDKSEWRLDIAIADSDTLIYQYAVHTPGQALDCEYGGKRSISLPKHQKSIRVYDNWRGPYGDSPFSTTVFKDIFFKRKMVDSPEPLSKGNLLLRLHCTQMEPNRHFAVVGNQKALGDWDVSKKVRLSESEFPVWTILLDSQKIKFPLEYKYLIVDTATDEVLAWGGGPNRVVASADEGHFTVVTDEHFLRTIPSWKGAGVAIPVFSLRSKKSFGTGEFNDLKLMVDWAAKTGQKIIQTLPINDTILYHTNYDSYPYNAVSVYALHPIYLHLEKLGKIKDKERKQYFEDKKLELNEKTFSDYQHVMSVKWEYFREIYPQECKKIFASEDYKTFFDKNKEWLVPYAAFSFLRDRYKTPEFGKWPEYNIYNKSEIESLTSPDQIHYDEIALYYFLQYHLHIQLSEVHDYARANGVVIKGDIPIGVSPRSVDAWVDPELFNTHVQAGAPPDDFSVTGQNWGFPTYNWDLMAQDGYLWWKKRFQKLAEYFDAYRIDHILGFFRIWEIPVNDVWGLTGRFNPALPFSRSELESRGLWWDENRYLKPYMKEHVLYAIFGKYTDDVIREYLLPDGWQNYKFKAEFDTQKKIEAHFASLGYNFGNKELVIRDGLYTLHCEVLFLCDQREPDKFHPRISMHSSATFRDLNDETRRTLDRIYVDYFYHRHNDFWKNQAMKKLPALLSATNMLVCGEDLGMVPDSVPDVMNALEILSLEIQRMPKKPNTEFAMPANAPYRSVCTTSTHDMNPIRAWWEEDPALTQRFYNRALGMPGPAPAKCDQWIAEKIVEQHLESNAMWVILPWQDWMAVETRLCLEHPFAERINVPSNPRNFWCYRMHITLEKLLKEDKFNKKISEMISKTGR